MLPIGWAVKDEKGRIALVLERPAADQLAVKVHGTVEPDYSGTQVEALLDELEATRAAHVRAVADAQHGGGYACSRH